MLQENLLSRALVLPTGCWYWTKGKNKDGYGYLFHEGRMQRATRLSYEAFVGPIPSGKLVLHRCDSPSCINPEHLFLGSHADNARDRNSKGRQAKGTRHSKAKITESAVFHYKAIRNLAILAGLGKIKGTRAARHHTGISQTTASHINAGRRWRHVKLVIPDEFL